MHDSGLGYRKISRKLNEMNIKTIRGNSWFNTSVSSVLSKKYSFNGKGIGTKAFEDIG